MEKIFTMKRLLKISILLFTAFFLFEGSAYAHATVKRKNKCKNGKHYYAKAKVNGPGIFGTGCSKQKEKDWSCNASLAEVSNFIANTGGSNCGCSDVGGQSNTLGATAKAECSASAFTEYCWKTSVCSGFSAGQDFTQPSPIYFGGKGEVSNNFSSKDILFDYNKNTITFSNLNGYLATDSEDLANEKNSISISIASIVEIDGVQTWNVLFQQVIYINNGRLYFEGTKEGLKSSDFISTSFGKGMRYQIKEQNWTIQLADIDENTDIETSVTGDVFNLRDMEANQWCNQPNPNFCPGNFFQNGDFEQLTGDPNIVIPQDIALATGWQAMWGTNQNQTSISLADLHCTGNGTGTAPSPNTNVYAGMWIENRTVTNTNDATYREAMYNRLSTPIGENTGTYSFNFKIADARVSVWNPARPVIIGIYGVYNPSNIIASPPSGSNSTPSNLNLWQSVNASVKVVLLGTITTPSNLNTTWMQQSITFNSNILPVGGITHIMITADDNARPKDYGKLYINFDEFCLQKAAPPISFDPCCPPMNAELMRTLFKFIPTGGINDPYKIEFAPTAFFKNSSQAYCDYIHTIYPNIGRLTFSWELRKADCSTPKIFYNQPVGLNSTIYNWFVPNGNGTINSQTDFFNETLNINECYAIHVGIFTEPESKALGKDCSNNTIFYFKIVVFNGMRKVIISDSKKVVSEYFLEQNNKKN